MLAGQDAEMSSDEAEAAEELEFRGSESEDASSELQQSPLTLSCIPASIRLPGLRACLLASASHVSQQGTQRVRISKEILMCCDDLCSQLWRISC